MTPGARLIVFDLDGTLIDSMEQYTSLFCRLLAERHNIDEAFSRDVYESMAGLPPGRQFAETLKRAGRDATYSEWLTHEFWAVAEKHTPPVFPEVADVLEALRAAGHTLVISSGGRPQVARYRALHAGIDEHFALVLGTDEAVEGMAKGPGHFAIMRKSLGLSTVDLSARGVFVGDGVYDMQVAREAGMPAVGRLTGNNAETLRRAGAEYLIEDLNDLEAALAEIERGRSISLAT